MRRPALLLGLAVAAACQRAAPPVPATAPAPQAAPVASAAPAAPSLYQRLGALGAIHDVVEDFHARLMADARISAFFRGLDDEDLKAKLTEQICQATGGPCRYTGRSMRAAHAQLNVGDADFDALVEDLAASLDHFHVGPNEKRELLTLLGGLRREIVTRR